MIRSSFAALMDIPPPYEEDIPSAQPSEPPMKMFLKWPYYRPPPDWTLQPAWNVHLRLPDWTAFAPTSCITAFQTPRISSAGLWSPAPFPSPPLLPITRTGGWPYVGGMPSSPELHGVAGPPAVKNLQSTGPSPFFARTPSTGPSNPHFAAYRKAQAMSRERFIPLLPYVSYHSFQRRPISVLSFTQRFRTTQTKSHLPSPLI
jgi:hypothetical protein